MSAVTLEPYRRVLANRPLRRILILGTVIRGPVFATAILVTIHVVTTLGRTYAEAGILAAAATLAIAVGGPVRGRMLDRHGLRRVVAPCLVVSGIAWGIAPWVGYWPLFGLVIIAGFFLIPTFSVIRQAVIAATPEEGRRSAISLDSAALEVSFMLVPAIAVAASVHWGTSTVLFVVQMLVVCAGAVLWLVDPPLHNDSGTADGADTLAGASWLRGRFLGVLAVAAASTVLLAGSDIAIVATMREFDSVGKIGLVLGIWALGSLIGGLVYGALPRGVPARWLLMLLAVLTFPMAFTTSPSQLMTFALLAGLLAAPTMTATVHEASRLVPGTALGEAMGWHGGVVTAGGAVGAPLAGFAVDHAGSGAGFIVPAGVSLAVAVIAALMARSRIGATTSRPTPAA